MSNNTEIQDSNIITEDGEVPEKCYIADEIDDYSITTVSPGEICTIQNAKLYGIFGKNRYFNGLVSKDEQKKINVHNGKTNNGSLSLCYVKEESTDAFTNCALLTNNPWKTLNKSYEHCSLPIDITLPKYLTYTSNQSETIKKPEDINYIINKKKLCNEMWYDWFSIPDYHIGNKIYFNEALEMNDDKVCYNSCEIGTVPWKNPETEELDLCIDRNGYSFGLYKNDFYYIPLALIFLFGSSKSYLIEQHISQLKDNKSQMKDIIYDYDIYNDIIENRETQENIFNSVIKVDLSKRIKNILEIPFDHTNILLPSIIMENASKDIYSQKRILEAYNIAKKYFDFLNNIKDMTIYEEFMNWKKDLSEVSGINISDNKFYKQLLILKKACNLLFDNKSDYSKNIFYTYLNTNLLDVTNFKTPIVFEITDDDIILSLSQNTSENTDKMTTFATDENIKKIETEKQKLQQEQIESQKTNTVPINNISMRRNKADAINNDSSEKVDIDIVKPKQYDYVGKFITIFVYGIVIILLTILIGFIIYVLWYPFAEIANTIYLGAIWLVYLIRDFIRGRYDVSELNKNFYNTQISLLNNIMINDKKNS